MGDKFERTGVSILGPEASSLDGVAPPVRRHQGQRLKGSFRFTWAAMTHHVNPVPEGYHTATPALIVDDAAKALEFYSKALGAKERVRSVGPGGKIAHAEFQVGDSIFMLADEFPGMGSRSPKSLGGSTGGIWLYVPSVDDAFQRAVAAGATSLAAPVDMFWGDRHARIRDPFGHEWSIASRIEEVSPADMELRAKDFYAKMAAGAHQIP
jgi:PhnB protein